jgi:hypothetical protein
LEVLRAVVAGCHTFQMVMNQTGFSHETVKRHMTALRKNGDVTKAKYAEWRPAKRTSTAGQGVTSPAKRKSRGDPIPARGCA